MKRISRKLSRACCILIFLFSSNTVSGWGFWAHKKINRMACFTLPPELFRFYKQHIDFITEHAISPDRRRYVDPEEAPKHFIDLDYYRLHFGDSIPQYFHTAIEMLTEDTLRIYGVVPWHINIMQLALTNAFKDRDIERILYLSAAIGHYIADAHVPLHCAENYNGQKTGQEGVHAFWESRIPELFGDHYDFFTGRAEYVEYPQKQAWKMVYESFAAVDSVLQFEKLLSQKYSSDKKYTYEQRGSMTLRVYSKAYAQAYSKMLDGQVERRMRQAIIAIGSFWYTAWVNAGSPDLMALDKTVTDTLEVPQVIQNGTAPIKGHVD